MDEKTFLKFYTNTVLGYSKTIQRHICKELESEGLITFEEQPNIFDEGEKLFFKAKTDPKDIILTTTSDVRFSYFYEKWEFTKLYKYSVPFFFEIQKESLLELIKSKNISLFDKEGFQFSHEISRSFSEAKPLCLDLKDKIFLKFTLQKNFLDITSQELIDYRYPIVVYFDTKSNILEIRYDSTKYNSLVNNKVYESMVNDCIKWLANALDVKLYVCDHTDTLKIVSDKSNKKVKIFKQMMELSSGGAAELKASETSDYVLPFIGEIRELIDENEDLFADAIAVKNLLLQYLDDKEATANYPYIYVKWLNDVESQSYVVKVTFDYFYRKYTLLQHITGSCKDLGMERMNNAIEYLCQSGAFIKGEEV
ncbi:hypothetical protein V4S36_04710 [Enterococcus cecorum]|uniref:hypothetical protein n=1 Tax=Enterococcus cecorum TaxID=44008 RepID=UPI003264F07C